MNNFQHFEGCATFCFTIQFRLFLDTDLDLKLLTYTQRIEFMTETFYVS